MRLSLLFLTFIILSLITACSSVPYSIDDRRIPSAKQKHIPEPAKIILVTEHSSNPQSIRVEEKTLMAGKPDLENYNIEDGILSFINTKGETYLAPLNKIKYQEGSTRINYTLYPGDYALIDNGTSKLIKYANTETSKKRVTFYDGDKRIDTYYDSIIQDIHTVVNRQYGELSRSGISKQAVELTKLTWEKAHTLNPKLLFDEYADTQTIGSGDLQINGKFYRFYVGYYAGTPLSLDLDGDTHINAKKISLHPASGETIQLWNK
ncbi:MAG: hypothetical protein AABX52_01720 [Nanoarchaeota archaeon]